MEYDLKEGKFQFVLQVIRGSRVHEDCTVYTECLDTSYELQNKNPMVVLFDAR